MAGYFCENCGNQLNESSTFCGKCGTPAAQAMQAEHMAQAAQAPQASVSQSPQANYQPSNGSVKINNLTDNPNIKELEKLGPYTVYEFQKDLSVTPATANTYYFMQEMNLKRRQLLCHINGNSVKTQAGAMQFSTGQVSMDTGIKTFGNLFDKALKGVVTKESAAKPEYTGNGYLMLEPTYKNILIEDLSSWGGGIVLDDGLFLACDGSLKEEIISRNDFKTALLSGEGMYNLALTGQGIAILESPVPRQELYEFVLENDEVRIDGNMAIAWSKSLTLTTEKSGKTFIESAISGEGFVNVFRGTGKILMAPTLSGTIMSTSTTMNDQNTASKGLIGDLGGIAKALID